MNVTYADKFASTDTKLLSAMHTFAKYSGNQPVKSVLSHFKQRGVQTRVQPTAVGQQKTDSKRRLSVEHPPGVVSARASLQLATRVDFTELCC